LEGQNEEEKNLKSESEKEVKEGVQKIEEATVSMFNTKNNGIAKVMKNLKEKFKNYPFVLYLIVTAHIHL
jgi:ABC-type proline/glycine betaine transport system permease subunit